MERRQEAVYKTLYLENMTKLTCNQLMLLLDIYRGTSTQSDIGTVRADVQLLEELGLIFYQNGTSQLTDGGMNVVDTLLSQTAILINCPENLSQNLTINLN